MYRNDSAKDPYRLTVGPSNWTAGTSLNATDEGFGPKADMALFDVAVYNRVLSAGERSSVFAYMKTKWATP